VGDVVRDIMGLLEEVGRLGGFISKVRELIVKEVMGVQQDHFSDFNVFGKLRVRQGKLLENLDDDADIISERGEHLDREGWNTVLDDDSRSLVLVIRNGYEWEVGTTVIACSVTSCM
jgi:predicted sulfurtransferase